MDYPEAHICGIENGYMVELYDMDVAKANETSDSYESPWKKFAAASLDEAFALIREKLPSGKSREQAMKEDAEYENRMAIGMAKSRFGGRY